MNSLFIENSIGEIIHKIENGEISPLDVWNASLSNINEIESVYSAWVAYGDHEPSLWLYTDTDNIKKPTRLLEHIPVGIKDIYNTADYPTQMGSPLWKDFTPGNDARAVFNIKRQGGVVIGKTVTAEFAVHALEKTLNPYDITKTPGTSSSGSAVAIALGQVPFAVGSQTAGSIVRPASFCGIYGCKPSFGTIPRTGTLKTTDSLDTLGFFTLHQEDLRRGFDAMRVHGPNYPVSHAALSDVARQHKPTNRPWRVAFVRTHTWKYAPEYAKKSIEEYEVKLSQLGDVEIVDVELPKEMESTHDIHQTIYNKTLSYYFKDEYTQADFMSPIMKELIAKGNDISLATYTKAIENQNELITKMDAWFGHCDILISLSTSGEAPKREVTELPDPALMWTLTHLPVVSVPQFYSPSGLPFGVQIAARKYNDYLLFNFLDYLRENEVIPKLGYYKKVYEK